MSNIRSVLKATLMFSGMVLLAASLHAAPPADKDKGGKRGKAPGSGVDIDLGISATITAGIGRDEARVLASEYGINRAKPLPPGIRKNLARGKPLPPGIQKTRMPQGFVDALPRHEGYEWRQAGVDLVLVASGSLVITDILEDVFD